MNTLFDLKEMLDDQLKKITKKGDISPTELEHAYKAVDIIKDIETIDAMKNADYGYSQGRMSYDDYSMNNSYRYDGSYDNHSRNSYARRGRDGDGDGRYSEARDRRGRYTSRDGYSGGTMREHLQEMLSQAQTDEERQAIRRCMTELNG